MISMSRMNIRENTTRSNYTSTIVLLFTVIGLLLTCYTIDNNNDTTINNNIAYHVSSFVIPPSSPYSSSMKVTQPAVVPSQQHQQSFIRRISAITNTNNRNLSQLRMAEEEDNNDDNDDDMAWLMGPDGGDAASAGPEIIECDVGIIGGGPAGCTCALYTSRADLKTVIVDKNEAIGALAITSHIANYPGVDRSMSGMELLQQMKTQAIQYGTQICDRAQVFMIEIQDDGDDDGDDGKKKYNKIVYTPEYTIKARSLVLATGAMGRSMPYLPGEEKYLGQGVSYCATCDGAFYRNSEVAVFGADRKSVV